MDKESIKLAASIEKLQRHLEGLEKRVIELERSVRPVTELDRPSFLTPNGITWEVNT